MRIQFVHKTLQTGEVDSGNNAVYATSFSGGARCHSLTHSLRKLISERMSFFVDVDDDEADEVSAPRHAAPPAGCFILNLCG